MYKENRLVRGRMRLRGRRVDLGEIEQNLLVVTAGADHIAPRPGTLPLFDLVSSEDVTHFDRPGGHIGLMAGSTRAQGDLAGHRRVAGRALGPLTARGRETRMTTSTTETAAIGTEAASARGKLERPRRVRHRRHARHRRRDLPQPRRAGRDRRRRLRPRQGAGRGVPGRARASHGIEGSIHQGNVGSAEDCRRMVDEVIEQHGRLDILVNNAGITIDKTVLKMTDEDWYKVIAVNLSGAFFMSQAGAAAHDRARHRAGS